MQINLDVANTKFSSAQSEYNAGSYSDSIMNSNAVISLVTEITDWINRNKLSIINHAGEIPQINFRNVGGAGVYSSYYYSDPINILGDVDIPSYLDIYVNGEQVNFGGVQNGSFNIPISIKDKTSQLDDAEFEILIKATNRDDPQLESTSNSFTLIFKKIMGTIASVIVN